MMDSVVLALGITNLFLLVIIAMLKLMMNDLRRQNKEFSAHLGQLINESLKSSDYNLTKIYEVISKQHTLLQYISQDTNSIKDNLNDKK